MRFMGTGKIGADPLRQLVGREQTSWFDNGPLAMDPLGFDRVEPRTLDWQLVHQQADSHSCSLDGLVMRTDPGADGLTDVPGRVVPDQDPDGHALLLESEAAPVQKLDGDGTHRPPLDKAQPDRFRPVRRRCRPLGTQQEAIAGQRFGIRVGGRDPLFHQPQGVVHVGPGMQMGLLLAAPPHLIGKAQPPVGCWAASWISRSRRLFFGCTPDRGWYSSAWPVSSPARDGAASAGWSRR